jgi:nitronate monooxygenase
MITTRFTRAFGLQHPVALAPMALATGGALAAAVSRAGGLGLIGGGYGDAAWIDTQWALAGDADVGAGLISWALEKNPGILDSVLRRRPRSLLVSFADPRPYAAAIHQAGVPLICQVQSLAQVDAALEAGAMALVAQGRESGGHGLDARATMSFVPELADYLAKRAPQVLLLAAGGIADGRGLAAALALGADGVLVGSRFWATQESLAAPGAKAAAMQANGDGTSRSRVFDILRRKNWPEAYSFRTLHNDMSARWVGREAELLAVAEVERSLYDDAVKAGDFSVAHVTVGEAVGLIHDVPPAATVLLRMTQEAEAILRRVGSTLS